MLKFSWAHTFIYYFLLSRFELGAHDEQLSEQQETPLFCTAFFHCR